MNKPEPRIVLGLGAGHCGLGALAAILGKQPAARISVAQAPLLPWLPRPDGPGIRERIARWRSGGGSLVGDVAAFYLPYAEAAVEAEPGIKMICLKRPEDEITDALRRAPSPARRTPPAPAASRPRAVLPARAMRQPRAQRPGRPVP
jgi:hypothetical protein